MENFIKENIIVWFGEASPVVALLLAREWVDRSNEQNPHQDH